jgi:FkbM family methyltransferase
MEIQLRRHRGLFGPPKVTVVGAAGGVGPRYSLWVRKGLVTATGFEADEKECSMLMGHNRGVTYLPFALGASNSNRTLFVTEFPECSSFLEPDMEVLSAYPVREWFKVVKKIDVPVHRFDTLYEKNGVTIVPDFLHIDVQGFEFEVLEGMGKYLDGVTCVEIETHLKPIYKEQKLFLEMKAHLEGKGFFLRDLEVQGIFDGEAVELNAFFCRVTKSGGDDRRRSLTRLWEALCNLKTAGYFSEFQWLHKGA